MSVLVVGSVALDSVETPRDKREDILGGSASFFSTVASMLTSVRLVAVVGEDFPAEHLEMLAARGVDLEGLQKADGRTFRWSGRYHGDMVGRTTLDTQLNVFEHFKPQLPDSYRDSDLVFLANIHPELQGDVLAQVKDAKFVALDTMNFWLTEPHVELLRPLLKRVDAIILNDEEARMLSGQHNLVKAAAAIRLMGVGHVVIKRGDAGAMLFDDGGIFWAAAFPLENVVDPTGAGDSFAGGFMAYLAHAGAFNTMEIRRAMIVGSAAASFAVEDFSVDRFRNLTRDQLLARCAAFAKLVEFESIVL
ncbi:MAG: sugar kinase [Myxococcales bacterium]|nr:sugar kinase [Myxococcales bacterium]